MSVELTMDDIIDLILLNKDRQHELLQQLRGLLKNRRTFSNSALQEIYTNLNGQLSSGLTASYQDVPFPVAHQLSNAQIQVNPLVKVLFLCDAVECFVRWKTAVAVLAVSVEREGRLPTGIADQVNGPLLRPSFGKWLGMLRALRGALANAEPWMLGKKQIHSESLNAVISIRNHLAHGNIAGDVETDLAKVQELIGDILKAQVALPAVLSHAGTLYSFLGPVLTPLSKPPPGTQALGEGIFVQVDGAWHAVPGLFTVMGSAAPEGGGPAEPLIGSYITSKGPFKSASDGSALEYTIINGTQVQYSDDVSWFISLFQTNLKIPATEQWKELLEEASKRVYNAWGFEHELLKQWMKDRQRLDSDANKPHMVWFGGQPGTGKSTVLQTALGRFQNIPKKQFLFLHRFTDGAASQVDEFFRNFRNAVVHWSLNFIQMREVDVSLTGEDLVVDLCERLDLLLALPAKPLAGLCVGVDDLHHLPLSEVALLRTQLARLRRSRTGTFRVGRDATEERCLAQVLIFLTGSSGMGQGDLDDLFRDGQSEWLYSWYASNRAELKFKKTKPRGIEVDAYLSAHYSDNPAQRGAHMPPIAYFGAKAILNSIKGNPQLVQAIRGTGDQESDYLNSVVSKAEGHPIYIDCLAEKLKSGELSVDDSLDEVSLLSTYFSTKIQDQFISDERRVLALVLCLLTDDRFPNPLTVTSLQMLNDMSLAPRPENEEVIHRAIQSAPGLLRSVPLPIKSPSGGIVHGWQIRSQELEEPIISNPELLFTRKEARRIIRFFEENESRIPEGTELKDIFSPVRSGMFLPPFRQLRDALDGKIITMSSGNVPPLFSRSRAMMLETCGFWSAQKTWLQKAIEHDSDDPLQHEAQQFLSSPSFTDAWLKRVNAPQLPIFSHERGSFPCAERISRFIALSGGFYLIVGALDSKSTIFNLKLYHVDRSRPLHSFSSPEGGSACVCLPPTQSGSVVVGVAEQGQVTLWQLSIEGGQHQLSAPMVHEYGGDVCGLLALSAQRVVVYGTRSVAPKKWAIDHLQVEAGAMHVVETWQLKDGGRSKPNNAYALDESRFSLNIAREVFTFAAGSPEPQQITKLAGAPKKCTAAAGGAWYWKGTKAKSTAELLRGGQLVTLSTDSPCLVSLLELHGDVVSLSMKGVLTVHGSQAQFSIAQVLSEGALREEYAAFVKEDEVHIEVTGARLCGEELIVFGKGGLLISVDIPGLDPAAWTLRAWPLLHYGRGAVQGIELVEGDPLGYGPGALLLSHSEDNDLRLWLRENHACIGLFRAHQSKIQQVCQMGDLLLSSDDRRNVCVWTIDPGCLLQRKRLPTTMPEFIVGAGVEGSQLTIVQADLTASVWEQHGAQWSLEAATQASSLPLGEGDAALRTVDLPGAIFVQTRRKEVYRICKKTKAVALVSTHDEARYSCNRIAAARVDGALGVVGYGGKKGAYHMVLLREDGALHHVHQQADAIDAVASSGEDVLLCTTEKEDKRILRRVYRHHIATAQTTLLASVEHNAAIGGAFEGTDDEGDQVLVFWDNVSGRPTQIFYQDASGLHGPISNPNYHHAPRDCILDEDGKGVLFEQLDSRSCWRLSWVDQAAGEEEARGLSLHLTPLLVEDYYTKHFEQILAEKRRWSSPLCSPTQPVLMASGRHGVNLYYRSNDAVRLISWSGNILRGYFGIAVLGNGRVLVRQNRELICLQLHQGAKPVALDALQ